MKLKKMICMVLVFSMALLPLAAISCGGTETKEGGGENQKADETGGDPENATEADDKRQYDPKFGPVDMKGYVFTFGTRDDSIHNYSAHLRDLLAEEVTGDLINDAVYARNMAVEEKYNCKIETSALSHDDATRPNQYVAKCAKAGDKSYDLLLTHMMHGIDSATNGFLHDIAKFPNIDLSKPYWNAGATAGLSLARRLYLGLSDLSFSANEDIYCIFFNKALLKDNAVENPYALVKGNKWTFDKFGEIIRTGAVDLNGDGKMDEQDQFGYLSSSAMNFLWSGGSHIMQKDADDMPYLDYNTPKTIDIFEKAYAITNNEYTYKKIEWNAAEPINMFANGQGLFYSSQLRRVNDLRAVEFDFGIVPYPKYDSAQKNYHSYVDGHASIMGIPICLPEPEWTGMLIEEISYLTYRDILPTYYDVVLNVKMVRDEESVEMLEILFASKVFDFGYAWGGWDFWYPFIQSIQDEKKDFVSVYEKKEAAALNNITKKIETVLSRD